MTFVDREYNRALDEMSGADRLRRSISLYDSVREMLALQVKREWPDLDTDQVALRVARRMYLSDAVVQRMLDELEATVG